MSALEIVSYDARWPLEFAKERERIAAALGSIAVRIEHHGSTSVVGLAAKPVIDIQISVAKLHPLDRYAAPLAGLGYVHVPHEDDAICLFFHKPAEWPHTHHIHVIAAGGDNERRTLAFRDFLRDHPDVAHEYETLKRSLAAGFDSKDSESREAYAEAKASFITAVTDRALAHGYPRERVDFSNNAPIYDERHGALLAPNVVRALTRRLAPGARIVDIGAGTGRVAVALAQLSFEVIAIEPSISMLQPLQRKVLQWNSGAGRVWAVAAEGSHIPLPSTIAAAVVLARLLYLVSDWRMVLREASALVRDRGLLLHEWANGRAAEPWVQIRERARSLFQQAGVKAPFHPGARTEAEVDHCLRELRFSQIERISVGPGQFMTVRNFLEKIENGEFSYVWNVPADVRAACLPRLGQWVAQTFDLDRAFPVPEEVYWTVYEKR